VTNHTFLSAMESPVCGSSGIATFALELVISTLANQQHPAGVLLGFPTGRVGGRVDHRILQWCGHFSVGRSEVLVASFRDPQPDEPGGDGCAIRTSGEVFQTVTK
jgi:hypothetical protein